VPTPTVEPAGAVLDRLLTTIEDGHPEALRGLRTGYPDWDRLGPGLLCRASYPRWKAGNGQGKSTGMIGLRSMKT
jgi:hypothetical protein